MCLHPHEREAAAVQRRRFDLQRKARRESAELRRLEAQDDQATQQAKPQPVGKENSSRNRLRPAAFADVVGQESAKAMMQRVIEAALTREEALDHVLLIGPAGTGKTTFANVIATALGRDLYQVGAPVSLETLLSLREVMKDGDILLVDEIHMQAVMERRGKEAMSAPEVFLTLLEDGMLMTSQGMVPFPSITVIGATTDPGRLPDPFLDRFPLEPRLDHYSQRELGVIAERNATALGLALMPGVADLFAGAARNTPRIVNNYLRNAASLAPPDGYIPPLVAQQVLDLNQVTADGLTREMQQTLRFLYTRCRRDVGDETKYTASISTIATAIGLSRDTKAVQLRVEPYMIQQGLLQVGHGGRALTPAGLVRAIELGTPQPERSA